MTDDYLVELQDIHKVFTTRHLLPVDEETRKRRLFKKRDVYAANNVSFGIRRGEVFGLLGPNGAGKTTMVKMISGLVRPDKGQALVDGLNVDKKRKQVLRKVGVVLEGTRTSIWPLTPLENLIYYGMLKDVRGKLLRQRAHDLLDFIGLKDKKNVQVRRLSRGQKQKLAICIALIADPQVLLLDEPTTGLDVQSSRAIKDRIMEMTRDHGRCVLVTTHDMHVAQELCDHIGIINHGKLIACKPTEALLDVFSEQVFVFRTDKAPTVAPFTEIPGVVRADLEQAMDGPALVVHLVPELEARSAALYAVTRQLEHADVRLRAIAQRQQNLENVFLRLTAESDLAESQ